MLMAFENLKEVLKFPFTNGKITLSLALLLLIPTSLIFLGGNLALKPFIRDLLQSARIFQIYDPTGQKYTAEISNGVSTTIDEETIITIVSVWLSLLSVIATIYTSAMTYYDHEMPFKDMFRTVLTVRWLSVTISALLLTVLISISIAIAEGLIQLVSIGISIALLVGFSSIYLGVVWMVGNVISTLIRACDEVGALGGAGDLLKGKISRRLIDSLLLTVVSMTMSGILLATEMGRTEDVFLFLFFSNIISIACLVILFLSVVYTLVCHECEKNQEGNVVMEGGKGYSLVSTTPLLANDSLP